MLTQVAERIYWFARYIERVENTARLILVQHQLMLDLPQDIQPTWQLTVDMLGVNEQFNLTKKVASEKNVISFVFGNTENPSSIISAVTNARENIRTTREILPSETWERLNSLYLSIVRRSGKSLSRETRHKVLNAIIQSCQQISGLLLGTMNHDAAYQFVRLGRSVERADMSTRIVDVGSASLDGKKEEILPYKNVLWISILRSLSGYQMYRQNVRMNVKRESVLNFLLQGKVFPRATAHQLNEIKQCVEILPNHDEVFTIVTSLSEKLEQASMEKMKGMALHEFIDELQAELGAIHNSIQKAWFY